MSTPLSFHETGRHGASRTGRITCGSIEAETPALLCQTAGGSLPSMPPDLAATLPIDLAMIDFAEVADFLKLEEPSSFFALPPTCMRVLSVDSMLASPLEVLTTKGRMVETATGRLEVTPETLRAASEALAPHLTVSLNDDCPPGSSRKRMAKARERNSRWLRTLAGGGFSGGILGPVVGGGDRQKCAEDLFASQSGLSGVSIQGLGCGEECGGRRAAVEATLLGCPERALRVATKGFLSPADILEGISLGLDVIGSAYPTVLTSNGQALSLPLFDLASTRDHAKRQKVEGAAQVSQVLDLRETAMRADTRPLVEGCGCQACAHHHRAYIHHLLLAHEMLADALLQMHNTHHLLDLFAAARRHLKDGTFEAFKETITGEISTEKDAPIPPLP